MSAQGYAIPSDQALRAARRAVSFDSTFLLSGAMGLSGVLTYAFHVIAAKRLGPEGYGQIALLWGSVFLVAIVLFRPLEQTLSRWISDRLSAGHELRPVLRSVGAVAGALLVGVVAASAAAWGPLTRALFGGDDFMTAMLVAGIVGYAASYLVRGILGGVRFFVGYGAVLVADSVGRLLVALPLLFVASTHLAAAAVAAAGFAGAVAPFLATHRWGPALRGGEPGPAFDRRGAVRFAAPVGVVAAADQILVNGAPLLVVVLGGGTAREAGVVFAATMLVRAPVYVFQGIAASLLPNFTLLGKADRRELRRVLRRASALLAATGVVIVAGVGVLGPPTMRILYGAEFATSRTALVLLGASVAFYLAGATFLQALIALRAVGASAAAWTASTVALVAVYLAADGGQLLRVSLALVAATALNAFLHRVLLGTFVRDEAAA